MITAILPGVDRLLQHLKNDLDKYRPQCCPHCGGSVMWYHGSYDRKSDRNGLQSTLNPITIPRFFCPNCKRTTSVLPECISPKRWYVWKKQQEVILLFLSRVSVRAIAKQVTPGRSTISRWISWIQDRYRKHKDVICNYFPNFGLANNYEDFWKTCFKEMSLSKAMYLCYTSGISVP